MWGVVGGGTVGRVGAQRGRSMGTLSVDEGERTRASFTFGLTQLEQVNLRAQVM